MDGYINRTLTYVDEGGASQSCRDDQLLSFNNNVVVLGEPGIGKSELLRWLAEHFGGQYRSAASFVRHPNPKALVADGQFMIVDGLDELAAARETDPINLVLGKLIEADCGRFILSCRSAEWRGAVARRELQDQYGAVPLVATLEGLTKDDAYRYLERSIEPARAHALVDSLELRGMKELYRNPLTLMLMRAIAQDGKDPHSLSRAQILKRACSAMWQEMRQRSDRSDLGVLDQQSALDAAGACFAAMILTGNDLLALRESASAASTALHHAEISALPGGADVLAVAGSRLFIPAEVEGHVKPIHRSVAEYLGAGWLAKQASDVGRRERLLSLITLDAGVPASLRGLHAWLPHFDSKFRDSVVSTDPYGILIYGDPDADDPALGRALLHALSDLEQADPYFRSDWRSHSAKALAHVSLVDDLRKAIVNEGTSVHLRTLLLQAITGTATAALLRDDLAAIMLGSGDRSYYYAEREDAADALIALQDNKLDWPSLVDTLCDAGDHDSTRLALHLIVATEYDGISAQLVARAALGHLGLLPGREIDIERSTTGTLYAMPRALPERMIPEVLDAIAHELKDVGPDHARRTRSELATFISRLVDRYVRSEGADPLSAARWLHITRGQYGYSTEVQKSLADYFAATPSMRRPVQRQAIYDDKEYPTAWARLFQLQQVNPGLALTVEDAVYFLEELARAERADATDEIWLDLLSFSRRSDDRGGPILEAAKGYAGDRADLLERIEQFKNPRPLEQWEIDDRKRTEAFERKQAEGWAKNREAFLARIEEIRAGGLRAVPAAQCYLGQFTDIDRQLAPPDRVAHWLGEALRDAALEGFEAALHRDDLPSLAKVAESYARQSRWNMVFPIIAGFVERLRCGRGFDDLPDDILLTIRLAIQNEHLDELKDEAAALDEYIQRDAARLERYLRQLIEPSLLKNAEHVSGLYALVRDTIYRDIAPVLANEWLSKYPDLTANTETELVDALINVRRFGDLAKLATERLAGELDDVRRNLWRATQFLVDFGSFQATASLPIDRPLAWSIRHVLRAERLRDQVPVAVPAAQLGWVVQQFRSVFPKHPRPSGVTSGDENDWDGTDFLEGLVSRLVNDLSREATAALRELRDASQDGYTNFLRHSADQQRRARREANFVKIELTHLAAIVRGNAPQTIADLQAVVVQALAQVQAEVRGSSSNAVEKYWTDEGYPRGEDVCTARLMESIREHLRPYGVHAALEALMPNEKRADLVFTIGSLGLPMECKGQWNRKLWTAARDQLEEFYLPDWRAEGRGIYLVYWFGPTVDPTHRVARGPNNVVPTTAMELKVALGEALGLRSHSSIAFEVLDLSR